MLRFRTAEMQHAISHAHFLSLGGSVVWSIVATVPLSLLIVATSGASASAQEEIRPDGRRIVGGEKTDIKRHPWQVALNIKLNGQRGLLTHRLRLVALSKPARSSFSAT
jgi:hypothetical protein